MALLGPQMWPATEPQRHVTVRNNNSRATPAWDQGFASATNLKVIGSLLRMTETHSMTVQNKFGDL